MTVRVLLAAFALTAPAAAAEPPAGLTPPGPDYRWEYAPGAGGSFAGYGWVRRPAPRPCPPTVPAPVPEPAPLPADPGATTTYLVECVMVDCTTADKRAEVMIRDYVPGGKRTVRIEPGVRLSLDWADATGLDPCQVYAWAFTEPVLKKEARVTTDGAGRITAVSVYHVLHDFRPWYAEPGATPTGGQQPTPTTVPVRRCPNVVAVAAAVARGGECPGGVCRPAAGPTGCPDGKCPLPR